MLTALVLAFRQLADPAVQRLVVRCVLLAALTFVGLVALVAVALSLLDVTGIGWLDATLAFAGSGVAVVLAWLLFPVVVVVTLNFFADEVANAVERRHYPDLPPPGGLSVAASLQGAARFAAVAVLLNLLVLPLYLLPGPNILVYLALNGYLLGREYFELVAQRRLSPPRARAIRRGLRARVWLAGVVMALLLMVPLLNLVAPVVATAFMVHLFERWRRRLPVTATGDVAASFSR